MRQTGPAGTLILIGGGRPEDRQPAFQKFVSRAGGERAKVVVISTAADEPGVAASYAEVFRGLGARAAHPFEIHGRSDGSLAEALGHVEDADGVFLVSGDHARAMALLANTKLVLACQAAWADGKVVAGVGLAAVMTASLFISEHADERGFCVGNIVLEPGIGLAPKVLIEHDFATRGRFRRLLLAVAETPQVVGLGIEANTAVVINGHAFKVLGKGCVTVIDSGAASYTNLGAHSRRGQKIILFGAKIHVLTDGCSFDLLTREPGYKSVPTA